MMADAVCNLHTGLQGHGKTLLTIQHVEALRLASNRQVFYSGIRGLKLDWTEFGAPSKDAEKPWWTDASEWFKLPTGSIIVIDEAQRLFRPRANGSQVPEYEAALETLRHNGHTLFLITQHPSLISTNTRRLCGVHRHFMRKLGSSWCTIHEWAGVRDNVDKTRKDSLQSQVIYPKQLYDKYQSSEVHTVKFGIPLKLKLALLLPVGLIGLAWWIFWGRGMREPVKDPAAVSAPGAQPGTAHPPGGASSAPKRYQAPQTPAAYLASLKPRVEGLPHTAPRYDDLTAPVRAPVIVGCWQSVDQVEGWCITQQGSRIKLPPVVMASYIAQGQFVDFAPGPALGDDPRDGTGHQAQQQQPRPASP